MFYRISIQKIPDVRKIGHIRYRSGWSDSYEHKWDVLIFVVSGEFTYDFYSHRVKLTSGMHLLIPSGTPYTATVGEDCDYYYAHFKCAKALETASEEEVVQSLKEDVAAQKKARNQDYDVPAREHLYIADTAWHGDRIKSLQYRISRCAEFRQGTAPLDRMRLLNSFFKVLISLASTTGEQLLDTKNLSPTQIKIMRYIEENYTSRLSLQTLSDHFSLSKQYIMRLFRFSGTSPSTIFWAIPSDIAVLPTPGSPTRIGLFLVLLLRICRTLLISSSLPITGSSFPWAALSLRLTANLLRFSNLFSAMTVWFYRSTYAFEQF
jgi:AraC-like DNA-binding protein